VAARVEAPPRRSAEGILLTLVRAAGGLVTREGPAGPEVVLVHRPAYDDWSFPKGKLSGDEDELAAALREVEEETTLRCRVGEDLGAITYVDGRGRPKVVRYWRMDPVEGEARGDHEVDVARWMPLGDAGTMLTYPHDRALLRRLSGDDPEDREAVPVYLIRHTKAGDRTVWPEPDELRPISRAGLRQARQLADRLADVGFTRLVSSPALRCIQTLEPLADATGVDIMVAPELSEGERPDGVGAWVMAAAADGPAALCTHGNMVQGAIETLIADGVPVGGSGTVAFRKGSAWRLDVFDGRVQGLVWIPGPE
jgi:8-oxo-dGTP pyrophosphatase MutT (NUDIX family)